MDKMQELMEQIDNIKHKLSTGEYVQLCDEMKKVAETRKRFIRIICIEAFMIGVQENLINGDDAVIMNPVFTYNHEDEGDARITLSVKQRVRYHTLECLSPDNKDSPDGFWLDTFNDRARLHDEKQIEDFKKCKIESNDNMIYIYVDDYYA